MNFENNIITGPFINCFKYKSMLLNSIKFELKKKYAGSILGLCWLLLYPTVLFSIYIVLYFFIFRVRPLNMTSQQYVLHIISGLVPFLGFSAALNQGVKVFETKKNMLLSTVYPIHLIPLQLILGDYVISIIGLSLLIVLSCIMLHSISIKVLLLPFIFLSQIFFTIGIIWVLSIVSLVIKDLKEVMSFMTMILMIVSPIAYTSDMVPHALKFFIWLNPFSYFVIAYQAVFLGKESISILFTLFLLSILSFICGYIFFKRVRHLVYDYV